MRSPAASAVAWKESTMSEVRFVVGNADAGLREHLDDKLSAVNARRPSGTKTGRPHRTTASDQAVHERPGPPAITGQQASVLLAQQNR
jgi:hypothetical protein